MRITAINLIVLCAALILPGLGSASGTVPGNAPNFDPRRSQFGRPVDQLYEIGKALYKGRTGDHGKLKFCVAEKGADVGPKIRGKSVKPFKGGNAHAFADHIYNCDDPEQRLTKLMGEPEVFAVLYYLDKRYKMKMTVNEDEDEKEKADPSTG